jgi:hypothetical protein
MVAQGCPSAAVFGGLSAGEFALERRLGQRASHLSIWARSYFNEYSPRATNRVLQRTLNEAPKAVLSCDSPKTVMKRRSGGPQRPARRADRSAYWIPG